MIGYGGRVLMWGNPFSFTGFLMQISECLPHAFGPFTCLVVFGGRNESAAADAEQYVSRSVRRFTRQPSI